ncbi:MAG TPA: hypothetical protein VMI34_12805 [Candidatus Bathyarchaeia archaeon]|nr:hypothetical protein [Candidatus Bathyarchaeia archaeon]
MIAGSPRVRPFRGFEDLAARFREEPPDVVVSQDPPYRGVRLASEARWLWLQYGADILFESTPQGFLDADAVGGYSACWRERLEERYQDADATREIRAKMRPVGMPELDALRRIDPEEVRRRLGLPRDRPIVLYLSFPLESNPPTFWLRSVFRPSTRLGMAARTLLAGRWDHWADVRQRLNDRRLVESVRRFCDRAGAALVMKSRRKDPIPRYASMLADRAFYDLSHYPPTILELLSVATLCIHAYSTTVLEAAYAGVPSLCLAPSDAAMGRPAFASELVHNLKPGWIYNWPGVAYGVPLGDAYEGLGCWTLDDFPFAADARRAYVERFLGFDDGESSARLLDLARELVREGAPAKAAKVGA